MKLWEKEGAEKFENLLKKFENHPLMGKIREDEAAETLTARQQAARKIEGLKKQQAETGARLQARAAEAERVFLQAKAAMEAAGAAWNQARGALRAESTEFERQIGIQEAVLIESSDPAIDEAIQFFRDKLDWLRVPGRTEARGGGSEKNLFAWTKKVTIETNRGAVLGALEYCQRAIKALEAVKLEPEFDSDRIEKMKAEIPRINDFTESESEKPLEAGPPRVYGADDGHVDLLLKKAANFLAPKKLKAA